MSARQFKVVGTRPSRPDGADKVTGRARFGADWNMPGQLVGRVLRSPHAHAVIESIDASRAAALPGVKAVVTSADFGEQENRIVPAGEMQVNLRDVTRNVMAREKALYHGHAVAAVAATTDAIAREALKLIDVRYRVLPHVVDVEDAMKPGAPILHDHLRTDGVEPRPTEPSNVAKRIDFAKGDAAKGFAAAEVVVERRFRTAPVHQGYIEPHACLASAAEDGQVQLWTTTQGHFQVRGFCSRLLGLETSQIRVMAAEIGGGFGGKTVVYLEPVAIRLSQKAGRPVKMVMTREEVFRASGPTSGSSMRVKLGATRDGRIVAADATFALQAGAFPGSPVGPASMCSFACYDIDNVKVEGFDVVSNRPKVAAYRAPGAPISAWAVESTIDELAQELGIDPIEEGLFEGDATRRLRIRSGVRTGHDASSAARTSAMNALAPDGPSPATTRRMSAEPMTQPSATVLTSAACAPFETPTPTSTGLSVIALRRPAMTREDSASASRSPVTPNSPTAYTNPRARATTRGSRSSGAVGAASITVSMPAGSAARAQGPTSSSGRSGRIAARTPASYNDDANRSWPMWKARL